jgi:methylmalonyl-CoA mutase
LRDQGAPEVVVVVGGVVPQQDYAFLEKAGVAAVFGPGTVISTAARTLLASIRKARVAAGAARI